MPTTYATLRARSLLIAINLVASAAAVAIVDQATKQLVTRQLADGESHQLGFGMRFVRTANRRMGLLPLSNSVALAVWLLTAVCIGVVAVRGIAAPALVGVGVGLVFGGATSNLADRFARACIVDFIAVGRWPTFNVADVALVVGTLVTLWSVGCTM